MEVRRIAPKPPGEVVEVGSGVRNLVSGDRVGVPSTISCGYCPYCRAGYQAQCDNANPGGKIAGTAFFGGLEAAGAFDGLQAESCGDECETHAGMHEHCSICAEACRACERACRICSRH